jgi:hypothetical protein
LIRNSVDIPSEVLLKQENKKDNASKLDEKLKKILIIILRSI